jgi:hypothetical protein
MRIEGTGGEPMKRVLIGTLIFVLYMALVIVGAFAVNFEGTKLVLFCVILVLQL